jgi:hypothetical protein
MTQSDCWTLCFFNTFLGNTTLGLPAMSREPLVAAWDQVRQENGLFFERFPYVCPEPALVKRSLLYINGSKKDRFRTLG